MKISNNAFVNIANKYTPPEEPPEEGQDGKKAENEKPELAMDAAFKKLRGGLLIYTEQAGKGDKIEKGSKVSIEYEGWLASDFTKFDSSIDKGKPFSYVHGEGNVIEGWDRALEGVRVGTKLQLKIPAKLAYGEFGMSDAGIPPNADLIFKLEVLSVERPASDDKPATKSVNRYA
jgi:FKBP-type peptidyl-prolyl cis-trans isomerase